MCNRVQTIYKIRQKLNTRNNQPFWVFLPILTNSFPIILNKNSWSLQSLLQQRYTALMMFYFFGSNTYYCPFVRMWYDRTLKKRIFRFYERLVHIIYYDNHFFFQCLLDREGSVSIHTYNLQILATEMLKNAEGIL